MINESNVASIKHLSRVVAATVVVFILIVCVFATNAFAGMAGEYNVVINDNGKEYTITTEETEPIEILNEANIALGSNDRLNIAGFEAGKGGTIVVDRLNTVNIKFNEIIKSYNVYADTVGDVFAELGIDITGCKMNYSIGTQIENGMVITVEAPITVTLNANGEVLVISAIGGTVSDVISLAGITLDADDYVEPSLETAIENEMVITVYNVEVKTETVNETVEFETETKTDDTLEIGESVIEAAGVNGERAVKYEITYVNGEEVSRTEISSEIIKEPVKEIKIIGAKAADVEPNGVQSRNGYSLGQTINGRYTHYCSCAKCCGKSNGVTASGLKVYTGMPNPYYVACNWLPLGSVISINGTNYTVVDHGGSGLSSSGRVDIYTPEGHQAAIKGGTGKCTITIVRLGW